MRRTLQLCIASLITGSIATVVLIVFSTVFSSCVSPRQASETTTAVKTAAGLVDLPGVNEPALITLLQGFQDRLAQVEEARAAAGVPVDEPMDWKDWMQALLGYAAPAVVAVAGAKQLDKSSSKKRGKSRAKTIAPILQVVDQLLPLLGSQADREKAAAKVAAAKAELAAAETA